ncbi:transcription factor bHLH118-like [Juglans microcarpa x Juglans regia]|uniref:transcription factor bHLH118-like n=1 Tax=Juglans microcarpa x Juglans regia TaxID=2249226 RepID=UPI001B7E6B31|nr:transcription factor bHLH118-like [Juglans microcarpa x Juglans regia]
MDDSNIDNDKERGRRWKPSGTSGNWEKTEDSDKKTMHREMERKRRKDMSELQGSLRSFLPLEYIKGKRSMSDHMNEAVNYIKHLQNNIKELVDKRDELKKPSNSIALEPENETLTSYQRTCVMIRPCLGGVEIMVSSSLTDQGLPLSRVLQVLLEEGIAADRCICTKVNERLIFTVRTEGGDMTRVDLQGLQHKLTEAIPLPKKIP